MEIKRTNQDFSNGNVGFVGAGRVARIMLQGWKKADRMPGVVRFYDPNPETGNLVDLDRSIQKVGSIAEVGTEVLFVAVHPPVLLEVLETLRKTLNPQTLVVSLAPKHTLATIRTVLGGHPWVARVNPSAPGVVGAGIHPWCATDETPASKLALLQGLLEPLGSAVRVAEPKIEAYALINAMGPTYFWFQWRTLRDLAREFGMDAEEAAATVEQMLTGAVRTFFHSGLDEETVLDLVPVKPLGDQESAIQTLFQDRLRSLLTRIRPDAAVK